MILFDSVEQTDTEVDDESECEVDWMRLWRHDAVTQHLYETAAFSRDQAGGLAYPRPLSPGVEGINVPRCDGWSGSRQVGSDKTQHSKMWCVVPNRAQERDAKPSSTLKSVVHTSRYSIFSYKL